MVKEQSLAVYKRRPALVKENSGDKIQIEIDGGQLVKVREKDIEIIHSGPVKDTGALEKESALLLSNAGKAVHDAWELLEADGGAVSLEELAELCFGVSGPAPAWAAFLLLCDNLYFAGSVSAISPRNRTDVEAEEKKRQEKQKETEEREKFLDYLRACIKSPQNQLHDCADATPSAYGRFFQDAESLALGQSTKSKTMKELGLSESPEDAHALLLNSGFWTMRMNPHPARFGLSLNSAKEPPCPPPDEQRRDLTGLISLAIDNPWTSDPDDAISIEDTGTERILYVHVADPASSVSMDSLIEREARDRGATLYLPEGNIWMLQEQALAMFGLGLQEKSPALTFKISLNKAGEIQNTEIFPSLIKARRLSYMEADKFLNSNSELPHGDSVPDKGAQDKAALSLTLQKLHVLAEQNLRRRNLAGAINIELPETHITLAGDTVSIEEIASYRSSDIVRECMLLTGEAAAAWVIDRFFEFGEAGPAFPFISQEPGELPNVVLSGPSASYQFRRCMRPRTVSVKPGLHWGLGLEAYTQVTSPLRRYTDLLAHIQLRALLRRETPLGLDEVSQRLAAAEAAAQAVTQAERASRGHWTMVYLAGKKDSVWDAIALEKKMNRWVFMIPALALETQVSMRKDPKPNETVKLVLKSVNIPRCEAVFAEN